MEVLIDKNLYHLQNVLFDLDNYSFDSDIIALLNDLKSLVDNKLLSNIDFNKTSVDDLNNINLIFKFYEHKRNDN